MDWISIQKELAHEPAYRMRQVKKALFVDFIETWDEVTVLPKALREKLSVEFPLGVTAKTLVSKDDATVKALITLKDSKQIESVLMRHESGRNTVCVSSLVGCPMGCTFCATATMGMVRKLTADEIVLQVLFFARLLKREKARVGSVVFMGMGEPFLNYEAVIEAVRMLHDPEMFGIGARHISISTCGILEGIQRLTKEDIPVNLAISLHGSNDEVREKLMPVARTYTIEKLMETIDEYIQVTNRKVMFEYLLVEGVNDADEHARELGKIIKGKLCMVNLISYNPTGKYTATSEKQINHFKSLLEKAKVEVSIRYRFGRDIEGACGQLATKSSS
ncbi:MAG: putative dual-specificity RNA methyltransferase RlmN [Parcubacteria group bacterium GW2011_GWA2_43_11]|nr:MAG: putative dual-specificity RNA methyltransferase RlmN [Parcubacteria group bacterium GW2011_GWA2_43_11]